MTKYLKEWQRLALVGKKLKAIRLYRKETGYGLLLSRPAVENYIKDNFASSSISQWMSEEMRKELCGE